MHLSQAYICIWISIIICKFNSIDDLYFHFMYVMINVKDLKTILESR